MTPRDNDSADGSDGSEPDKAAGGTYRCGLISHAAGTQWSCNRMNGHAGPCSVLIDEVLADEPTPEPWRANWVPAPQYFNLNMACVSISEAFGTHCYLVGSALATREHRDVDVRLILPDEDFARLFPNITRATGYDARWSLLCSAISAWLSKQSNLQVDFQIQQRTAANAQHHSEKRHPIGMFITPAGEKP